MHLKWPDNLTAYSHFHHNISSLDERLDSADVPIDGDSPIPLVKALRKKADLLFLFPDIPFRHFGIKVMTVSGKAPRLENVKASGGKAKEITVRSPSLSG